jgi:hypothetical protein
MSALLESIPLESAWRLNALRMNASSLRFAAAATALANCAGLGLGEPDAFDGLAEAPAAAFEVEDAPAPIVVMISCFESCKRVSVSFLSAAQGLCGLNGLLQVEVGGGGRSFAQGQAPEGFCY